ncbi:MAG: HAMP domain-containing sensor histidine kinase [Sulfurospirillaceae bacterium]|nr:HAMP domain-containing sensor histidine kinase [Sulfurospirillaceae bacterium]
MFKKWQKRSINQINMYAIFLAGVFAFAAAFIVIFNEYLDFNKEVAQIERSFIQNQKTQIIKKTKILEKLIRYNYESFHSNKEFESKLSQICKYILNDGEEKTNLFIFDNNKRTICNSKMQEFSLSIKDRIFEIANKGGGFLDIKYGNRKYMIYIKKINKLGLVYGGDISIDDFKQTIELKRIAYKNKIAGFVLKIFSLTLLLYIISIIKYRFYTKKLSKELKYIIDSFKVASMEYRPINLSKIEFFEFNQIALHANDMIYKIKNKNRALVLLNEDLGRLVEEKTEELRKSMEKKKELLVYQEKFVRNAIHEINTPLSIILINIELYNLKFEKNNYLANIEAAVKVLENIYGDLGYIVKKDRVVYEKNMINFSLFISNRIEYFQDVARGNDLVLKAEIDDNIFILFNEVQLQRLCDNSISNAIKYSFANEVINVKLYEDDNLFVLEVSNKGEKIKNADKLFEKFYREDKARGGFGLGLNIVKEICDTNDVKIIVVSEGNIITFKYFFSGVIS